MSDSTYVVCGHCGLEFEGHELLETGSGAFICQSCYDDDYFTCDDCGEIVHNDNTTYVEYSEEVVCDYCLDRNYTRCDECGAYIPDNDTIRTVESNDICESCCSDHYFCCDECGDIYHQRDYGGDGLCVDCGGDRRVHDYSYRPSPIFHRTAEEQAQGRLYFGIELELSHDSNADRSENITACLDSLNDGCEERNVYLKQDGSLATGFEIVSHPRTLESWHEFRPRIEKYFMKAQDYTDGTRDGLHVHISRRGMSPAHMARFGAFVAACQDEITLIARRDSRQWAKYHKKPKTGNDVRDTVSTVDRYTALNWCPSSTVELRVFRATLDATEFYAAIEFAHASYQFTKRHIGIMEIIKGNPWEHFLAFLNDNKTRYLSLIVFLRNRYVANKEHYGSYIDALTVKQRSHKK